MFYEQSSVAQRLKTKKMEQINSKIRVRKKEKTDNIKFHSPGLHIRFNFNSTPGFRGESWLSEFVFGEHLLLPFMGPHGEDNCSFVDNKCETASYSMLLQAKKSTPTSDRRLGTRLLEDEERKVGNSASQRPGVNKRVFTQVSTQYHRDGHNEIRDRVQPKMDNK